MNQIRDLDFGGAYPDHLHWLIAEVPYFLEDPSNQFVDKKLNQLTHDFAASLSDFAHQLASQSTDRYTVDGKSRIKQAYHDTPPYDRYTREDFESVQADLNKRAAQVYQQYSDLVAAARRKL